MTIPPGFMTPTWGRPNPIDEFRYSHPQGSTTEEIARYYATTGQRPAQLSNFLSPEDWAAESPAVREQRLSYLLNNPNQFAPGGRTHSPMPPMFSSGGGGIPFLTAPGVPGMTGGVPSSIFDFTPPGSSPSGNGNTTGGGSGDTTPKALPESASNPSPGGDAAGVDTGAGGSAGQSFGEGGRAFGPNSQLSFMHDNPMISNLALTVLGQVPVVGPIASMISGAKGFENALQFFTEMAPNFSRTLGLIPDTLQLTPEQQQQLTNKIQMDIRAQNAPARSGGELDDPSEEGGGLSSPVGAQAGQPGAASVGLPGGIPGGSGGIDTTVGEPGSGGIDTGPNTGEGGEGASGGSTPGGVSAGSGGVDANAGQNTGEGASAGPGGSGGASGGTGGVSGGTGGVDSSADVGEGPGPGGTASGADVGGQAADTGGGDGGGGGGGGGGCALANWALNSLKPADEKQARRFFQQFYEGFMKLQGPSGKRLFSLYQVAAQRVMAAVQKRGGSEVKRVQQEIYDRLVKPTGKSVEAREIPTAVKNLVRVVTSLAQRYDVPLTPEMTRAARLFTQGTQPRVFARR